MLNADPWTTPSDQRESYAVNDIYKGRVSSGCDRDSGCMIVTRKREYPSSVSLFGAKPPNDEDVNDSDDEDWVEEDDEDDDEPLEYCSEEEALGEDSNDDAEAADVGAYSEEELSKEAIRAFWLEGMLESRDGTEKERDVFNGLSRGNDNLPAWYRDTPLHITPPDPNDIIDNMMPLFKPGTDVPNEPYANESSKWKARRKEMGRHRLYWRNVEHIAGPGCKNRSGYNGHEIDEVEMRNCQISQCLVRKPPGWTFVAEADDEEFERTGEFFLSGLSDHMPSRDYDCPRVDASKATVVKKPHAENSMWDPNQAFEYALPFHPSCLEVFKRTSLLLNGKVDISSLTSWWSMEADYEDFHDFPRDPKANQFSMQEWDHIKGTAYLTANPLYIPRLEDIFQDAIETAPSFNLRDGAFKLQEGVAEETSYDPFALLPGEIQTDILDRLSSKDIAALRLSSRALCQLPVSYFQKLLLREMPWLWEAWPTNLNPTQLVYAKWATASAQDLKRILERPEKEADILNDYINIIKKEMPELAETLDEAFPAQFEAIQEAFRVDSEKALVQKPFYLPPGKCNYFKLYTLITRHWKDLRGLQNRKRIWEDCEEILRRVKAYKEMGKIDEKGITGNLPDVVIFNAGEQNRKREEKVRRWEEERNRANQSA